MLHVKRLAAATAAAAAATPWCCWECTATAQLVTVLLLPSRDSVGGLVFTVRVWEPTAQLPCCAAAPPPSVNCLTSRRTLPRTDGASRAVRGEQELVVALIIEVAENDTASVEEQV